MLQQSVNLEADFLQAVLLVDYALVEFRDDALDRFLDLQDHTPVDASDVQAILVLSLNERPVDALEQLLLQTQHSARVGIIRLNRHNQK